MHSINGYTKIKAILGVFRAGEKLKGDTIGQRLRKMGYKYTNGHLKMFIYHHMLYQHLEKENINKVVHYYIP